MLSPLPAEGLVSSTTMNNHAPFESRFWSSFKTSRLAVSTDFCAESRRLYKRAATVVHRRLAIELSVATANAPRNASTTPASTETRLTATKTSASRAVIGHYLFEEANCNVLQVSRETMWVISVLRSLRGQGGLDKAYRCHEGIQDDWRSFLE